MSSLFAYVEWLSYVEWYIMIVVLSYVEWYMYDSCIELCRLDIEKWKVFNVNFFVSIKFNWCDGCIKFLKVILDIIVWSRMYYFPPKIFTPHWNCINRMGVYLNRFHFYFNRLIVRNLSTVICYVSWSLYSLMMKRKSSIPPYC